MIRSSGLIDKLAEKLKRTKRVSQNALEKYIEFVFTPRCFISTENSSGDLFHISIAYQGQRFTIKDAETICKFQLDETQIDPFVYVSIIAINEVQEKRVYGSSQIQLSTLTLNDSNQIEIHEFCNHHVVVGMLRCVINLINQDEDCYTLQLKTAEIAQQNALRNVRLYAKTWWNDFKQACPYSTRLVKLFAENEHGYENFVCSFVKPISCALF
jgi:hypothetical protein